MIIFYKCISIKVTEKIVNPIIVFATNLKLVLKNEVTGVVITMQNTTIFQPLWLRKFDIQGFPLLVK